ncbi:OrdA [Beauveria brongniartii RCEF 3172]|uniref:OrdA n=1 Tax=Beauveria brongniartii RCEF 3172 TaxID=1081107 RepID=A0A166Z4X6_9HYPO|nr:OrdA [Beauveria brongniartii RCEF 3172]
MAVPIWLTWVLVAVVGYLVYKKSTSKNKSRLPPGPKPMPVLGNINDLPRPGKLEYRHWLEHKDVHGLISSVTVMGMTLVIVHDKKAAHQLLDQVAAKTSGRPTMVMANQLCGYEAIVVYQSYTCTIRRCRKYLHRELAPRRRRCSSNMSRRSRSAASSTAAATVLKMAYGYTIEPDKPDMLVDLIDRMVTEFSLAAVPMAWAVDIIPALRYLPEGIPGVRFKETARRWKRSIHASGYIPYDFVRRQMASFASRSCYVSKFMQQLTHESADGKLSAEDEHAIIWTAASLYGAAADTTVITITAFTAAMIMFPEVSTAVPN